jgi:hypothetical protein
VRGPFRPAYSHDEEFGWVAAFTSKLSSAIKLVGTSINCHTGLEKDLHLQSMVLATDAEGYNCCIKHVMSDPPCNATWDKTDVIGNREIKFSTSILDHGYSLNSLMLAWHGVDVNRANGAVVATRCTEIVNMPDGGANKNDMYRNNELAGEINLNPLVSITSTIYIHTVYFFV